MSQKFTEGFKIQAVENALDRSPEISLVEIAETLGVSRSALQRWISQSNKLQLEALSFNTRTLIQTMLSKENKQDVTYER